MKKETITTRQAVCILIIFLTGSNIGANISPEAEQDTWVSFLMALVCFLPLLLVYARVMKLFPQSDLFQIIEALFGKFIAKVLILLMFWYSVHAFSLAIRNLSEFVKIAAMPETPQLPIMLIMMLMTAYIAKSGSEALGKWSVAVLPLVLIVIGITVLLALNKMDFSNIQPFLAHDIGALSAGAFNLLTLPFAETVLFLGIAGSIKSTDNPRSIYLWGIVMGALISLTIMVRNIEVIGVPMMKAEYYPSYIGARIINIGDVITRTEGTIWTNYILSVFTKGALCLLFAAKGAASLFGVKNYKKLVMPVGLLSLALAAIVYKSTMEMFAFIKVYPYYALPFEIAIPLIVWITAEIKKNKAHSMPARQ